MGIRLMPPKKTTATATAMPTGTRKPARSKVVRSKAASACWYIPALFAFTYFIVHPSDVALFTDPVRQVLDLFTQVTPWLYVTAIACMLAWTANRVWGKAR